VRLDESAAQLIRGLAPLGAFALGLALERIAPHAALRPAWRANLGLWFLDAMLMAAVCGACGWTVAVWAQKRRSRASARVDASIGIGIAATVVGLDLVSYGWHRANHEVGFLWRFHRVHHADADYHVATALASTRASCSSRCRFGSRRSLCSVRHPQPSWYSR